MKATLKRSAPDLSPQERIISSTQFVRQLYAVNPNHPVALNYIADHFFWEWITVPDLTAHVQPGSTRVQMSGDCSSVLRPGQPIRLGEGVYRIRGSRDAVEERSVVLERPYAGEEGVNVTLQVRNTVKAMEVAHQSEKEAKTSSVRSEAMELIGRCYHINNDWAQARKWYEKAIQKNKRNVLAQYGMAQV